jgi:DNA-binding NarL/FixJ family response regulator
MDEGSSPTPGASDVGSNSSNINYKDLFVNKHEKQKYGDKKNMTLYTKGLTQSEIAEQLQVDQSTV